MKAFVTICQASNFEYSLNQNKTLLIASRVPNSLKRLPRSFNGAMLRQQVRAVSE